MIFLAIKKPVEKNFIFFINGILHKRKKFLLLYIPKKLLGVICINSALISSETSKVAMKP